MPARDDFDGKELFVATPRRRIAPQILTTPPRTLHLQQSSMGLSTLVKQLAPMAIEVQLRHLMSIRARSAGGSRLIRSLTAAIVLSLDRMVCLSGETTEAAEQFGPRLPWIPPTIWSF